MQAKDNIQDIIPLTPLQQGMLFHTLLDENSRAYFLQYSIRLDGKLNKEWFVAAYHRLIERHDTLRTTFIHEKVREPYQVILKSRKPVIFWEDISQLSTEEQASYVEHYKRNDIARGFHLDKDMLIRVKIIQTHPTSQVLVWSMHHILMDGWCIGILWEELMDYYRQFRLGKVVTDRPFYPFRSFIDWLFQQDVRQARAYWKNYVGDYQYPTHLPRVAQYPADPNLPLQKERFRLEKELYQCLLTLCESLHLTPYTVIQAAWAVLLQRYCGRQAVLFGSVVSGRPPEIPGIEQIVGLFINTLPVKVVLSSSMSFSKLCESIQENAVRSAPFESFPLVDIQSFTPLRSELFDHLLVFENFPAASLTSSSPTGSHELMVRDVSVFDQTHYFFDLTIYETNTLEMECNYHPEIYSHTLIRQVCRHFNQILAYAIHQPECLLSQIPMLNEEENQRLIYDLNKTQQIFPFFSSIHALIENRLTQKPEQLAVVSEDHQLTYAELDEKATRLAVHLCGMGVDRNALVAIYIDRSVAAVMAVLAVWKAGGACLPISTDTPADRRRWMLEDSQPALILTHTPWLDSVDDSYHLVNVDEAACYTSNSLPSVAASQPGDLAYVVYTSGSTGLPKGVMIEHASLINAAFGWIDEFGYNEYRNVLLQTARISFDVFIGDIVRSLTSGGTMVICPWDFLLDFSALYSFITRHSVSFIELTPAVMLPFLEYLYDEGLELSQVHMLNIGSDVFRMADYQKIRERVGQHIRVINSYGLTEATVDSCYYEQTEDALPVQGNVPIGKPMPNIQLYILDQELRPLPLYVTGDIYVGGKGVGRGFLNRPQLTSLRYIDNPFIPGEKMYKTGDVGRWLEDGNIDFSGRSDFQINIHGNRVEAGEVENRMLLSGWVDQAMVLTEGEEGNKQLVAYYTVQHAVSPEQLRAYLSGFFTQLHVAICVQTTRGFPPYLTWENRPECPP